MTKRQILIGDVHGHYDALKILLEAVAPGQQDRVYFLGDLIDRGPKSSQVIELVMQNNYSCILGNHEDMLLAVLDQEFTSEAALQAWLYSGGYATIASYGEEGIPKEHIEWLRTLPNYLDLGNIWLVHAGVNPNLPLDQQTSEQFCWIREEFHRTTKPYFPDKLIITGHTITFTLPGVPPGKIASGPGWLDIDTGAYHRKSGWLTALDFTHSLAYQVRVEQQEVRLVPLAEAVAQVNSTQASSQKFAFPF
ncbi:MAG: metallophosphoesterase family protein [Spirulinaceae cyanobacterium]